MTDPLAQARDFFLSGIGHYEAGRFDAARLQFEAALALAPGRASVLTNLGATLVKLGDFPRAADVLEQALAQAPDDAHAWGHRAFALAELGRSEAALDAVERSLALAPNEGAAWSLKGTLLRERGQREEAAQAYREALARGADDELNRYYLASLEGRVPPAPPRSYVEALFDGYAEGFDAHLVDVLRYRAPQILAQRLRAMQRRFACALDLGCGTGLCGEQLRLLADRLEAVDLSASMVRQARAQGLYDEVTQADAADFLRSRPAGHYDLVVAADVFIYVGALEAVFESGAHAIARGGVLCFSVEEEAEGDFALRPSLRYAHSRAYIERLAAAHGFEVTTSQAQAIREDQREPVAGLFFWLRRR